MHAPRSLSMAWPDPTPLNDSSMAAIIKASHNNRLGAVYSALYRFWASRDAAMKNAAGATARRRDAYSVVLFHMTASAVIENDTTSTPEQMVHTLLNTSPMFVTNFRAALSKTEDVIRRNWSPERLVVFRINIRIR